MPTLPSIDLPTAFAIGIGLLVLWIVLRFVLRLAQVIFNLGCIALVILFIVLVAQAVLSSPR